ncbi:hypothetical protein LTR16_001669 [Cryomyces antarcticus]|uniref:2EXR domain-containing protein n=1 Tax=Cryomyces antarcticus TaxID=329879 RepID=A0ABR0LZE6_9PEZI|nr:hypothetical protein LTR16_001669 [Cryomyces antarcticus]
MAVTRSQTAKRRHLKAVGGVTRSQTVKHRQFKSAGHSLVAKSTYHSMGKKTPGQRMSSGTGTTTGASPRAVKVTCYGTYKGSRASQGLGGYVLILVPVKKPFPFLKLPAELRNRIYEDALLFRAPRALHDIVRDHARDSGDEPSQTVLCQPALTRVCKQIREESLPVYYGLNEFSAELLACKPRHNASAWLARIGNANCLMVRHLIIHVSASVECISVDSCRFRHLPTLLHSQGIRLEHPFKIMDYNWTGDCFVSQYNALHPRASLAASGWVRLA